MTSAVDKIVLANDYKIKDWLLDAYDEVCARREPLTIEEGQRLGMDTVIKIANFRERCYLAQHRYGHVWELKKVRGEATLDLTEELSKEFGVQ